MGMEKSSEHQNTTGSSASSSSDLATVPSDSTIRQVYEKIVRLREEYRIKHEQCQAEYHHLQETLTTVRNKLDLAEKTFRFAEEKQLGKETIKLVKNDMKETRKELKSCKKQLKAAAEKCQELQTICHLLGQILQP